jgi:hypothetical protein
MAYAGVLDQPAGGVFGPADPQSNRIDYHQLLEKLMIL